MCFEKGVWLFVSCFGGCLIAAAPQQQQEQPPVAAPAAGSNRQQAASASSMQQQAAAGSRQQQPAAGRSRQEQAAAGSRQQQAAAKFQFYSRVSEVTLGPFWGSAFKAAARLRMAAWDCGHMTCVADPCAMLTPADARGSAPGNKTFSADHLEACNSSSNSSSRQAAAAAAGSSRQQQAVTKPCSLYL